MRLMNFPMDGHACPLKFGSCKSALMDGDTLTSSKSSKWKQTEMWGNSGLTFSSWPLQMLTPSARLCTHGKKVPCPLSRCPRSPPACCSMTSLVRRCQVRGWNLTQVIRDCTGSLKIHPKLFNNQYDGLLWQIYRLFFRPRRSVICL